MGQQQRLKHSTTVPSHGSSPGTEQDRPSLFPVGWEQLPVTEGASRAESTKVEGAGSASSSFNFGMLTGDSSLERHPYHRMAGHQPPKTATRKRQNTSASACLGRWLEKAKQWRH